jgi:hypothetical protein
MEGARALCSLFALTSLTLHPLSIRIACREDAKAVELLLHSFGMLEDLELSVSVFTDSLTDALATHPSLSHLLLNFSSDAPDSVCTLLSESSSISALFSNRTAVSLECLQRNVHLLNTNLFARFNDMTYNECKQLKYNDEARNRRLLHNWQCVCLLLASYRANHASHS